MGIRHSFVDVSEAWLLIVPITTYLRGPDYPGVNRIILKVTDERHEQVAVFRCSLPKAPPANKTRQKMTDARDARKMCKDRVALTRS